MCYCEGKLNRKTAHLPLPSVAQKRRVVKLPSAHKPNIFAQDILNLTPSKTAQKFFSLPETVIFCEFYNLGFVAPVTL